MNKQTTREHTLIKVKRDKVDVKLSAIDLIADKDFSQTTIKTPNHKISIITSSNGEIIITSFKNSKLKIITDCEVSVIDFDKRVREVTE